MTHKNSKILLWVRFKIETKAICLKTTIYKIEFKTKSYIYHTLYYILSRIFFFCDYIC